jgi:hypothetical protein
MNVKSDGTTTCLHTGGLVIPFTLILNWNVISNQFCGFMFGENSRSALRPELLKRKCKKNMAKNHSPNKIILSTVSSSLQRVLRKRCRMPPKKSGSLYVDPLNSDRAS